MVWLQNGHLECTVGLGGFNFSHQEVELRRKISVDLRKIAICLLLIVCMHGKPGLAVARTFGGNVTCICHTCQPSQMCP